MPTLTIGGVEIEPPPSIFLQAVPAAEAMLIDLVMASLPKKAKRVCDLFSGIGTFALPIARKFAVTAYDSDKRAIHALQSAAKKAQGLKPIEATLRDLFREPLSVRELDQYDCVVLDPPRAGAAAQSERLAKSKVPVVIAVSCAPATLARDARTLIDGGYSMGPVTPIDQFLFSPHVEAVAVFQEVGSSQQQRRHLVARCLLPTSSSRPFPHPSWLPARRQSAASSVRFASRVGRWARCRRRSGCPPGGRPVRRL